MASDVIAWCFFEIKDKSDVKMRDFETMISKDDDISLQSNLFIYNILSSSLPDNELVLMPDEANNFTVIMDELYRPGYGVEHKRSFYGIWREDVDTTIAENIMQQLMSSEYRSTDAALDDVNTGNIWRKKKSNSEDGLLVIESEKWERRKDLTGVVLKITTNAVNRTCFYYKMNIMYLLYIYKYEFMSYRVRIFPHLIESTSNIYFFIA